ncbi:MAG: hypothetical protein ACI4K7_04565 [Oscillospiraceae bacterium]
MFEFVTIIRSMSPNQVGLRCCECGASVFADFDKFESVNENSAVLKRNETLTCPECDSIQSDRFVEGQETYDIPECPSCHSVDIEKISTLKKYSSFAVMGVFSGNMGKQFHCRSCGYRF